MAPVPHTHFKHLEASLDGGARPYSSYENNLSKGKIKVLSL